MKRKGNPSKAGVSAASVKGSAGPGKQTSDKGRHSNNAQYGKQNMGES
ncbi:YuzL family protein [Ectobacillus ponti]|uniref:YuzL family protein n=1 Tax=Ectobacillus ponti TaxID=2961894 RepID=A0AA41XB68_9BACI|nr:YuzL family protein [Ectobacillus ponti]MCP8969653.1 YuzL family protein [Ectobacillus ponti]